MDREEAGGTGEGAGALGGRTEEPLAGGPPEEPLLEPSAGAQGGPSPEDAAALAEEQRTVDAAALLPAAGAPAPRTREANRTAVLGVVALVLVVLLGWLGGAFVWQLRRDLAALEARLAASEGRAARSEQIQARAALLRVQADLEALRQNLPADGAEQVAQAQVLLRRVAERQAAAGQPGAP